MLINNLQVLSKFIQNERNKQNMSQSQVAELVGIKQATVSSIENKPNKSQIETLFKIVSALGLEIHINSTESNNSSNEWDEEW